jgi:hypothetical protein
MAMSPKSVAFPVDAIVMYWMTFELFPDANPPAKIPRVGEEQPAMTPKATVKLPKFNELPVEAIVT